MRESKNGKCPNCGLSSTVTRAERTQFSRARFRGPKRLRCVSCKSTWTGVRR